MGVPPGIKTLGQIANLKNLKRLKEAGATSPKGSLGLVLSIPRLLVRGPSLGIISRNNAFAFGSKPAIHDRDGTLTWAELDRRANRAASMLAAIGASPGDRVAMLLRNGHEMAELILGCQKSGIVACPLNTWAKPKELTATIGGSKPVVLIYDQLHAEQVKEAGSRGAVLVQVGEGEGVKGSKSYEVLLADASARPPAAVTLNRGSARIIIHTSGTTGTPKGASRDSSASGIGALANILGVVPYRRDDVLLIPTPMFHSFGLASFSFGTALGTTMVMPERFDPAETLELIEKHKVTALSLVPVMIRRIVALPEAKRKAHDLSSLRILMASGSVLSDDLRRAATELFGPVMYDLYGSTEIGWVAIATPEDIATRPRTVGKPVEGTEVAVFSASGEKLGRGEIGELYIKSEILFEGYISGDTKDERDGYMSIGDLGHFDEDGFLYVEARTDDMVVVGGENVYPVEVEQIIEDIPGVEEVTVFGMESEEYGHVLIAFVVGKVTAAEVKKACKAELASYKVPKEVKVVKELPRTSTGKVLKRELLVSITS